MENQSLSKKILNNTKSKFCSKFYHNILKHILGSILEKGGEAQRINYLLIFPVSIE